MTCPMTICPFFIVTEDNDTPGQLLYSSTALAVIYGYDGLGEDNELQHLFIDTGLAQTYNGSLEGVITSIDKWNVLN